MQEAYNDSKKFMILHKVEKTSWTGASPFLSNTAYCASNLTCVRIPVPPIMSISPFGIDIISI